MTAAGAAPAVARTAMLDADLKAKEAKKAKAQAEKVAEKALSGWKKEGIQLAKRASGSQWEIADWLVKGEDILQRKKERYDVAVEVTGMDRDTLIDMASVASSVKSSLRTEKLSFFHHRLVRTMDPKEQKKWLALAEEKKLSVNAMRLEINNANNANGKEDSPKSAGKTPHERAIGTLFSKDETKQLKEAAKKSSKTVADLVHDIVMDALAAEWAQ